MKTTPHSPTEDPETRRLGDGEQKTNGHAHPPGSALLDIPTPEENEAALDEFFASMRAQKKAVADALPAARAGIETLVQACRHKTGQSYHLRSMLYSLWNGKPTSLVEIVNLDRPLREALLDVMRVFGADEFFYDEIFLPFKAAGLADWFIDEREVAK